MPKKKKKKNKKTVLRPFAKFPVASHEFQTNVSGKYLHIISYSAEGEAAIVESFNLDLGISVFLNIEEEEIVVQYGDFPPQDEAVDLPPPTNRKVSLFGSLASIQYNQNRNSLNLGGIGTIDILTTDPIDFTFVTAPFKKTFEWDTATQKPAQIPIKTNTTITVVIDHVHIRYVESAMPFWDVTVYFKPVISLAQTSFHNVTNG